MKLFTIPNIITLCNLFCGCLVVFSFFSLSFTNQEHLKFILVLTTSSLILDFLDGFIARILNSQSAIGKELDSLADLVSFGLVPSLIMYKVINEVLTTNNLIESNYKYLIFLPIVITLFSALRLAKFNVADSETNYFKGLATPANTILILSVGLVYFLEPESMLFFVFNNLYFLISICFISSYLLVSNIPMFSFKLSSINELKKHFYIPFFIIFSLTSIISLKFIGLFVSILSYILISILFKNKIIKK